MLLNLNVKIKLFLTRRGTPQNASEAGGLTVVRLTVWKGVVEGQNHSPAMWEDAGGKDARVRGVRPRLGLASG